MTNAEVQQQLEKMVRRIVESFHPDKIILFGSHARNAGTSESDVDLLVVMPFKGSRRKVATAIDVEAWGSESSARRPGRDPRGDGS